MLLLLRWLAVGLIVTGAVGDDGKSPCLYSRLTPDAVVHASGVRCTDIAAYCWSTAYGDSVRAACPQTCSDCLNVLRQPGVQIEVGGIAFELLPAGSDAPANIGQVAADMSTGGTTEPRGRSTGALALVCLVTGAVVLVAVFGLISWHARSKKNDFRFIQARIAQQMDQSSTDDFEWDGVLDDFKTVPTRNSKLNGGARTSGLTEHTRYPGGAFRTMPREHKTQSSDIDLQRKIMHQGNNQRDPHRQYKMPPPSRLKPTNDPSRRPPPQVPHRPSMHELQFKQLQQDFQQFEDKFDEIDEAYEQPSHVSTVLRPEPQVQAIAGQGGRKDGLVSGGGRRFPAQQVEEPTYELAISAPPLEANYELCGSHVGSTSDSVAETLRSTESHGYELCGSAEIQSAVEANYELAINTPQANYELAEEGGAANYELAEGGGEATYELAEGGGGGGAANYELAEGGGSDYELMEGDEGADYELMEGGGEAAYELAGQSGQVYQNYADGAASSDAAVALLLAARLAEPVPDGPQSTTDSLGYEMCGSELAAQAEHVASLRVDLSGV